MITKDAIFIELIKVAPGFKITWDEFVNDYKNDPQELPLFICMNKFAQYLIALLEKSDIDSLSKIFTTIDELYTQADDYTKNLITVGLIEDLQNESLYSTANPNLFLQFFTKQLKELWDNLNQFWEGE